MSYAGDIFKALGFMYIVLLDTPNTTKHYEMANRGMPLRLACIQELSWKEMPGKTFITVFGAKQRIITSLTYLLPLLSRR